MQVRAAESAFERDRRLRGSREIDPVRLFSFVDLVGIAIDQDRSTRLRLLWRWNFRQRIAVGALGFASGLMGLSVHPCVAQPAVKADEVGEWVGRLTGDCELAAALLAGGLLSGKSLRCLVPLLALGAGEGDLRIAHRTFGCLVGPRPLGFSVLPGSFLAQGSDVPGKSSVPRTVVAS